MKTTTNNAKPSDKTTLTSTLMAGALLALLTLPAAGFAGQQTQVASQEGTANSSMASTDRAENYGDINDEEDGPAATGIDTKSDVLGKRDINSHLMIASNGTSSDSDTGGYGDNQDDG